MTRSQFKKSKTVENNSQSLEISKEKNLDDVPLDLATEIFLRLPLKSVARFLLLSKLWAEVIRSRHFITSFEVRSSLQPPPRLLVVFIDLDSQENCADWYFFSVSSSSKTSYLSRVSCPFPNSVYYPHYVNGLISLGYGLEKYIANPSTGRSTVLPRVESSSTATHSYFGYDPVNDEYKQLVLCMEERRMELPGGRTRILRLSSQHQVVTLGAKEKTWRMIDYTTPRGPVFNSVCIAGVLYYVAFTGDDLSQLSLMRFDLGSEKLDLFTSLPADFRVEFLPGSTLIMSYMGKVALATKTVTYEHEVWILDQHAETPGLWKKRFRWNSKNVYWRNLFIRGTTHTGELILARQFYHDPFYVVYYNPDTNSFRKIKVKVHEDYVFERFGTRTKAMVFSDYVESVRLL